MTRLRIGALACGILFLAGSAHAQANWGDDSLYIEMSPAYPQPEQTVRLTIRSPLSDLDAHLITWRGNGAVLSEGAGRVSVDVTAPGAGETTSIDATVSDIGIARTRITPASVDLVWETPTLAPALYRGKHLPVAGAPITLQAIPHISNGETALSPSELIFKWSKNGQILGSLSGRGRDVLRTELSTFDDRDTISVVVTSADRRVGAQAEATVYAVDPVVRLYYEHPLYGLMDHAALGSTSFTPEREISFAAVPYFVAAPSQNDRGFSYVWHVNRDFVEPNAARPSVLTIDAGERSRALIELDVTHKDNFLFRGEAAWTVVLGTMNAPDPGSPESAASDAYFGR